MNGEGHSFINKTLVISDEVQSQTIVFLLCQHKAAFPQSLNTLTLLPKPSVEKVVEKITHKATPQKWSFFRYKVY